MNFFTKLSNCGLDSPRKTFAGKEKFPQLCRLYYILLAGFTPQDFFGLLLVLDNLNTHSPANVYEILPPQEARQIVRKIDFQYTPKHAGWLNMAEIEIGVLNRQCLRDRYISSLEMLQEEVSAWAKDRNIRNAKTDWRFAVDDARKKIGHLYPKLLEVLQHHVEEPLAFNSRPGD